MAFVSDFIKRHTLIAGALTLTAAGFASRFLGFFYRIFLSRTIGAEGLGLYQMIFPVYGICFSLCAGSIQTAVSRLTASEPEHAEKILRTGLLLSLALALPIAGVIRKNADLIASAVLLEPRCADLLSALACAVPITAVHACVCGYYYGKQKVHIPAASQLAEQLVRMSAVFLIADVCRRRGTEPTAMMAAAGLVIGEAGSAFFAVLSFLLFEKKAASDNREDGPGHDPGSGLPADPDCRFSASSIFRAVRDTIPLFRSLTVLAAPLAAGRLVMNLLQSAEAVLIPSRLVVFGLTRAQAVGIYGVLTGMSMSFIMFPSALVNSLAVVLLPSVARAQSAGNDSGIERSVAVSLRYSLYMGILCIGIFTVFGNDIGTQVFRNRAAGVFIMVLAWLCPFLYLSTTLGSVLNGLGMTGATFLHNLLAILIRLLFVYFGIPRFGIAACLWGMLAGELTLSLLHFFSLMKAVRFRPDAWEVIVKPVFCLAVALGIFRLFPESLPFSDALPPFFTTAFRAGAVCAVYLLMLLLFHREHRG